MVQYRAVRQTLGELLTLTATGEQIVVPEWQRSYSWGVDEAKTFWEDLTAFGDEYPGDNVQGHEYFLGSIVLIERKNELEVLDEQQRLATATILLSVIRDHLALYSNDAASSLAHTHIVQKNYSTSELFYKLRLGKYDADYFRREIQDVKENNDQTPIPKLLSHKRVHSAKGLFEAEFKKKYDELGGGKPAFDWALGIQRILMGHLSVVEVRSTDEDSAAEVFETLNNRGISLSATDLLRNLVLRRSQDHEREEINDSWESIFQLEKHVEEFLRHWWLSTYGDLKGSSLYKALRPKITSGDLTPIDLTRQLDAAALIYKNLLDCRDDDPDVVALLHDVRDLGAKVCYPLLLSVFISNEYRAQRKRVLRSLLALFVRHNVIGGLESTNLEKEVYDIARQVNSDSQVSYVDRMKQFAPDDEQFERDFQSAQVSRQATAKYLLREIEDSKHSTSELAVQGGKQVHLEHVYPKTPENGQKWDNHEEALHRIGNLTLLSGPLNQGIRNGSFSKKKPAYEASEILITKELNTYDDWNQESINVRQVQLAKEALEVWVFPS